MKRWYRVPIKTSILEQEGEEKSRWKSKTFECASAWAIWRKKNITCKNEKAEDIC